MGDAHARSGSVLAGCYARLPAAPNFLLPAHLLLWHCLPSLCLRSAELACCLLPAPSHISWPAPSSAGIIYLVLKAAAFLLNLALSIPMMAELVASLRSKIGW